MVVTQHQANLCLIVNVDLEQIVCCSSCSDLLRESLICLQITGLLLHWILFLLLLLSIQTCFACWHLICQYYSDYKWKPEPSLYIASRVLKSCPCWTTSPATCQSGWGRCKVYQLNHPKTLISKNKLVTFKTLIWACNGEFNGSLYSVCSEMKYLCLTDGRVKTSVVVREWNLF